uniref:Uncharacterized protein n=1 Tax=Sphaerodactylus townsendi TaxID=933632 RepID=A0ACB8G942_9SAUR
MSLCSELASIQSGASLNIAIHAEAQWEDVADADFLEKDPKKGNDLRAQVETDNIVTSTLTVQEYFAKRMAKLKKARDGGAIWSPDPPPVVAEQREHLGSQMKKRKSHTLAGPENENSHEEPKVRCPKVLMGELDTEKLKKKKKKSKRLDLGSLASSESQHDIQERGSCFTQTSSVENCDSEVPKPKKKNKKKHRKLSRDTTEDVQEGSRRKKKEKLFS